LSNVNCATQATLKSFSIKTNAKEARPNKKRSTFKMESLFELPQNSSKDNFDIDITNSTNTSDNVIDSSLFVNFIAWFEIIMLLISHKMLQNSISKLSYEERLLRKFFYLCLKCFSAFYLIIYILWIIGIFAIGQPKNIGKNFNICIITFAVTTPLASLFNMFWTYKLKQHQNVQNLQITMAAPAA